MALRGVHALYLFSDDFVINNRKADIVIHKIKGRGV
jgi:hypothetical protein